MKKTIRAVVAAFAVVPMVAGPAPAQAAPSPVDVVGLDFHLINAVSRQCLTVSGPALGQRPCGAGGGADRWRFAPASYAGIFQIRHAGTERCLSATGAAAVLGPCDTGPARRWRLLDSADPYAQVRNEATGRCLTVAGGRAVQWRCDNAPARRWTVRVVAVPFLGPLTAGR